MRRLGIGGLTLASALVMGVAGCGGSPKSDPSPTVSTSAAPSPSSSTSPTAPTRPTAASANTKAGAIAFVRYYVELINHAQATGDVRSLASVEANECGSCVAARNGVAALYESGGSIVGGDWAIESISALRNKSIAGWVLDVNVSYGDQTVSFGSSKPDKSNKAGRMLVSIQVRRAQNDWQVLEWTRAS